MSSWFQTYENVANQRYTVFGKFALLDELAFQCNEWIMPKYPSEISRFTVLERWKLPQTFKADANAEAGWFSPH